MKHKIICGDAVEELKQFEDNSIDSCVCDPPYNLTSISKRFQHSNRENENYAMVANHGYGRMLRASMGGFMGKEWDGTGISFKVELWQELYRALKPGAHILVAGIARTHHRMWVALEDAGFEIRDGIYHVFGSGFPKSTDISKSLDKMAGKEREVAGYVPIGYPDSSCWGKPNSNSIPQNFGISGSGGDKKNQDGHGNREVTIPFTEEAIKWNGWGTALKPAVEIWCLARKPISECNIAANVLKWSCGGINVDGCRIGTNGGVQKTNITENSGGFQGNGFGCDGDLIDLQKGRFPANLILECCCEEDELMMGNDPTHPGQYRNTRTPKRIFESEIGINEKNKNEVTCEKGNKCVIHTNPNCVCRMLDEQSGNLHGSGNKSDIMNGDDINYKASSYHISYKGRANRDYGLQCGGASRFFYQAKASQNERWFYCTICKQAYPMKERDNHIHNAPENEKYKHLEFHPTQKPLELIQYLVRLVTPPNGTVLDLFMGTGTTLVAAEQEGFNSIGVDSKLEYCKITERRLQNELIQLKINQERSTIEKTGF